jgi:hypothetical protein
VPMETASANPGDHRTLGIVWLIFGVVRALGAVWMVLYSGTLTVMWGALLNRVPDPLSWMSMFHFFLVGAIAFYVILAILSFLAGFSILSRPASAGSIALVAAFLALVSGPLGVAIGVPTIVVFFPRGGARP